MVHIKRIAGFEKVDMNPKFEPWFICYSLFPQPNHKLASCPRFPQPFTRTRKYIQVSSLHNQFDHHKHMGEEASIEL